jgi:predicted GNAT family acetyltransferase
MGDPIVGGLQALPGRNGIFGGRNMSVEVINDEAASRYELHVDREVAIAAYRLQGDFITFTHTEVPPALEGRGVGSRLIEGALADVRAKGLRVIAECSFVADYLERHPADRELTR